MRQRKSTTKVAFFVFFSIFVLNAFQKNQYLRTKIEKNTKKATLVVDFRYLINNPLVIDITKIKGSIINSNSTKKIEVLNTTTDAENNTVVIPGLFWLSCENLQKGDVLSIDFKDAIIWKELENKTGSMTFQVGQGNEGQFWVMNSNSIFEMALNLNEPWYIKEIKLEKSKESRRGQLNIFIDIKAGAKFIDELGDVCSVQDTE